jgi:predicted  nucleic acid-binding Zn-ribbon protein
LNKDLEQLVKLSNYDKQIVGFEPQIKEQNDKLKVFTKTTDSLGARIEKLFAEIEDATSKKSKNNIHLKELASKLEDIKAKYDLIKTEKESKALQLEEEIAKEQINYANNEISRLDDVCGNKTTEVEELKAELETETADVAEIKEAVNKMIVDIEVQKNDVSRSKF